MKTFATVAAVAALSSTTLGATVTLKETPCLQETELQQYIVELDKLVVQEMESVCGLEIVSASDDIDISKITCQAFKDAEGTQPGSAKFTSENPALISTNPVQEASVLCEVSQTGATVTIKETPCLQEDELEEYTIEISKLVVQEMSSVCGLEILSVTGNVDIDTITCQAFKDAEGKETGSAPFTKQQPALISTNPVQEKAVRCDVQGGNGAQATATSSGLVTVYPTGGAPAPTGNATITGPRPTQTGDDGENAGGRTAIGWGVGAVLAVGAVVLGM